jgi:hypothetical protein
MSKRSFFEEMSVTAQEHRLRRDIDEATVAAMDASSRAEQAAMSAADDVAYVSSQVAALHKDVSRLTAMVGVLAEALAQRGGIDMSWAADRLRQQLQIIDPPPPPPPEPVAEPASAIETYRGDPNAEPPAPPPKTIACERCHVPVDETRTYVTEHGTVCEACYHR